MLLRALALLVIVPAWGSVTLADEWNGWNDPYKISSRFVAQFNALPLSGTLEANQIPWSDTYWPSNKGGIANRWHAAKPIGFGYSSPSREQARAMAFEQLSQLSPAEKYDLYAGNYDYPTVHRVWGQTSPSAKEWEGICNGWSAAAVLHAEPAPVTLANPDGILVPFGSADVKALMAYFYAWEAQNDSIQVGARCSLGIGPLPNCSDVNAGAFHIVLTNQLGLLKQGFVADVDRGKEVWNQPVYSYESRVIQEGHTILGSASSAVRRVLVETKMTYTDEIEPSWDPVNGTANAKSGVEEYQYWLELNSSGQIVGGEWVTWLRPDFVWVRNPAEFSGAFAKLREIYRPASH